MLLLMQVLLFVGADATAEADTNADAADTDAGAASAAPDDDDVAAADTAHADAVHADDENAVYAIADIDVHFVAPSTRREKFCCGRASKLNSILRETRKMGKSENFELHWLSRHIWSHWLLVLPNVARLRYTDI